jgi:predicted ATPase
MEDMVVAILSTRAKIDMQNQEIKTSWYVITGGPSSGKTTTVNLLKDRGYKTTIEHARHYIDTQKITGKTVEEIRANQIVFQRGVLDMQIAQEKELSPDETVFLDRAAPDALAYYHFLNLPKDAMLYEALHAYLYKKVYVLDPLPLVQDYARTEDGAAQHAIHQLLIEAYESLGYPVIHVPILPPEDRVDFILKHV